MGKVFSKKLSRQVGVHCIEESVSCREGCHCQIKYNYGTVNYYFGNQEKVMIKKVAKTELQTCTEESVEFIESGENETRIVTHQFGAFGKPNSSGTDLNKSSFSTYNCNGSLSEDYSTRNEKFEILQIGNVPNAMSLSTDTGMMDLKQSPDSDGNTSQVSTINNSRESSHVDMMQIIDSVNKRPEDSHQGRNCSDERSARQKASGSSGVDFSILSGQRPSFPAEGEEDQPGEERRTRHLCSNISVPSPTQRKTVLTDENERTSEIQVQETMSLLSRSVTGYPCNTDCDISVRAYSSASDYSRCVYDNSYSSLFTDSYGKGALISPSGSSNEVKKFSLRDKTLHNTFSSKKPTNNSENFEKNVEEVVNDSKTEIDECKSCSETNDRQTVQTDNSTMSDEFQGCNETNSSQTGLTEDFTFAGKNCCLSKSQTIVEKNCKSVIKVDKRNCGKKELISVPEIEFVRSDTVVQNQSSDSASNDDVSNEHIAESSIIEGTYEALSCENKFQTDLAEDMTVKTETDIFSRIDRFREMEMLIIVKDISFLTYVDFIHSKTLVFRPIKSITLQILALDGQVFKFDYNSCADFTLTNWKRNCMQRMVERYTKVVCKEIQTIATESTEQDNCRLTIISNANNSLDTSECGHTCISNREASDIKKIQSRLPKPLENMSMLFVGKTIPLENESMPIESKSICMKNLDKENGPYENNSFDDLSCCDSSTNDKKLEQLKNVETLQIQTQRQRDNNLIGIDREHQNRPAQDRLECDPISERQLEVLRENQGDKLDESKSDKKAKGTSRGKKKRDRRRHNSSALENVDSSISDSSLEGIDSSIRNRCSYCRNSLDVPNKKCKHHKKLRLPNPESKQVEDFQGVERLDSGIATQSRDSSFPSSEFTLKKKKYGKSSLNKIRAKRYKIGKFLKEGRNSILKRALAREYERQIVKGIVREIHVDHRKLPVFGLGSFFDRFNNEHPPPTTEERLQYEWLRLATFQHYTGNGNALALARNGFFHDRSDGPTSTRCYLCNTQRSNWELFDDVNAEHRRQSPNCPFHTNNGQASINISISSEDSNSTLAQTNTSEQQSSAASQIINISTNSSNIEAAVNETERSLQRAEIGRNQASSSGGESVPQQPTEDPQSRDKSLLVLPEKSPLRAIGRSGHTYTTVIAPRMNNVATGARSNAGIATMTSGSATLSTPSQLQGTQSSSILGGPIGAGAFHAQQTDAKAPVSTANTPAASSAQTTEGHSTTGSALPASQGTPGPGAGGRGIPPSSIVIENPRHPDNQDIDRRIETFQGWPPHLDQAPRQMAEAGFFFVGVADFTRCFCCGGGLRNWEPGDDPVLEHTRWFPRCQYINKLKGERYVAAVQRRHEEHMAEQQRRENEQSRRRDENQDPMATDAAEVLLQMGFSADRILVAILAVRQQTGSLTVTTQQVLTWLLDEEDRQTSPETEALGVRPPGSTASATPSSVANTGTSAASSSVNTGASSTTSGIKTTSSLSTFSAGTTTSTSPAPTVTTASSQQTGTSASTASTSATGDRQTEGRQTGSPAGNFSTKSGEGSAGKQSGGDSDESKSSATGDTSKTTKKKTGKKKSKTKSGTKSETSGATGGDIDAKSLKAENEKLREMQTCKICMEQPVNTTLLPCGHLVCCESCAARLQRCPICRKRIKGTVKTFMS